MKFPVGVILANPLFAWMTEENLNILANCFNMEAEEVPIGKMLDSGRRMGCLLCGRGTVILDGDCHTVEGTAVFGVTETGERPAETVFAAQKNCLVLWADAEILTTVCYRACWFHGRFVSEVKKRHC